MAWHLNLGRSLFEGPGGLIRLTTIHCWAALAFWNVAVAVPGVRVTTDDLSLLVLLMLTVIAPATAPPSPRPSSPAAWSAPRSPVVASTAAAAAAVSPLHVLIVAPRLGAQGSPENRNDQTIRVAYQISLLLICRRRRRLECRLPAALNASFNGLLPTVAFPSLPVLPPTHWPWGITLARGVYGQASLPLGLSW